MEGFMPNCSLDAVLPLVTRDVERFSGSYSPP